MNILVLTVAYLRDRALNTILNLILLALGIGTIVVLILFGSQLSDKMTGDARGFDMVVGAKGSPMQLVLSAIYHVDIPTGNIPLEEVATLRKNRFIRKAIPLALGDSYRRFRIVGTEADYPAHYRAAVATGRLWNAKTFEVTLGSEIAASTGLTVGQTFAGSHGLGGEGDMHGLFPYTVVGILKPTGRVVDRLILTSIEAVWSVHGDPAVTDFDHDEHAGESAHEDKHEGEEAEEFEKPRNREVTAVLVSYSSPVVAASLPRSINRETALQAASPAVEVTRLFAIVGVGIETVRAFGLLLVAAAALSVFIALTGAMQERRYDLAVMRSLGATRSKLFGQVLLEGLLLAGLGTALGLALGHGVTEILGRSLPQARAMGLTGLDWQTAEYYLLALGLGVGIAAAAIPAAQAFKVDIAETLVSR